MSTSIVMPTDRTARSDAGRGSTDSAWMSLGWFGFALAVIGLGQVAIYFYPPAFGSPEWEFGALAQGLGSLPLPTMGIAAMVAAAVARGSRRALALLTILLILLGVVALLALALFWSVVPMALRSAPEPVLAAIRQTVARTSLSGAGFALLYLSAAVLTARRLKH